MDRWLGKTPECGFLLNTAPRTSRRSRRRTSTGVNAMDNSYRLQYAPELNPAVGGCHLHHDHMVKSREGVSHIEDSQRPGTL
jgi:hypothetical protein